MLDGDLGQRAVHEGQQSLLDDDEDPGLRLAGRLHLVGERRHDAVGDENAGEGAHQGGPDQASQQGGGLVERPHCLHDTEDRRHDPQGRQAVGHVHQREVDLQLVAAVRRDLLLHQRLDLVGPRIADQNETDIVADEQRQFLVARHARIGLEDLGLIRLSK